MDLGSVMFGRIIAAEYLLPASIAFKISAPSRRKCSMQTISLTWRFNDDSDTFGSGLRSAVHRHEPHLERRYDRNLATSSY